MTLVLSTHWRRKTALARANEIHEDQFEAAHLGGPTAVVIVNGYTIATDARISVRRRGRGDFRHDVMVEPR